MRTHEYEPIPGLPEELPEGEEVLWQGKPAWWSLTKRALHVRIVASYFIIVAAYLATQALVGGAGVPAASGQAFGQLLIGALAVGLLSAIGRWMAQTTLYTITNRRLVMRIGAALPMTINLPYARLEAANLAKHKDGTCDISLRLFENDRVSFFLFWPHVRPWRLRHPEPTLRSVADGDQAARVLAQALEDTRKAEQEATQAEGAQPEQQSATADYATSTS